MAEMTKIKKAVDELRHEFWFLREPTFNEVALKSGILNTRKLDTFLSFSVGKMNPKNTLRKMLSMLSTWQRGLTTKRKASKISL